MTPNFPTDPGKPQTIGELAAFVGRIAREVKTILVNNLTVGDNILGADVEVSVTHATATLLGNPMPRGVAPRAVIAVAVIEDVPGTTANPSIAWSYSATTKLLTITPTFSSAVTKTTRLRITA